MAEVLKMTAEVTRRIGDYLQTAIPAIVEVYEEFPEANQTIVMPSVSIITAGAARFSPAMNRYSISTAAIAGEDVLKTVQYVIGEYEIPLQLDLWCRNKFERDQMLADLVDAMTGQNPDDEPQIGVILDLTDYYGQKCHYDLGDYSYDDSEAASQRKEWRVKIDLLATCKAVVERDQAIIVETETETEISDQSLTE